MRKGYLHAAVAAGLVVLASACAAPLSTREAGIDYNRAFAGAHNDIILLNILRASEREPLQFSAITGVTGPLRSSISLKLPFTNIIAGGTDAISPEITAGIRNPNVTISPLDTCEFIAGLVRPVPYETIISLMTSGPWPADALVLAVGGVECSDGRRVINTGSDRDIDDRFRQVLSTGVQNFEWKQVNGPDFVQLRMTAAEAMEHLDDTLTGGRRITSIVPASGIGQKPGQEPVPPSNDVIVTVQGSAGMQLTGASLSNICRATASNASSNTEGQRCRHQINSIHVPLSRGGSQAQYAAAHWAMRPFRRNTRA